MSLSYFKKKLAPYKIYHHMPNRRMHFSFYSKDALPSPTFKPFYSNGISFQYFQHHHENIIDKLFNVWERKQAWKKHPALHIFKTATSREGMDNATGKQLDNINVVRVTSCFFMQVVKRTSWHFDNINLGRRTSCFFLCVQYNQLYLNVFDLLGMKCMPQTL